MRRGLYCCADQPSAPLPFNPDPTYPIPVGANRADTLNAFAPDIQIARVRNWTVGFARSVSKDMAVEIRYVGNKGDNQWQRLNYNCSGSTTVTGACTGIRGETLVANGFMNEFKLAMANLQANNASGLANRAGSFAYFGSGTGTSPLPIYLAYLNGSGDYGNPAAYTSASTTWANATIAGRLAAPNPNPGSAAGDLDGNVTRSAQAQRLGYPLNFFALNPAMRDVNVTDSGAFSKYNALQFELRRRLSGGLSANVNYQYAFAYSSSFDGFSFGRAWTQSANVATRSRCSGTGRCRRPEPAVRPRHPPVLDAIVGGWSVNGVGRLQTSSRTSATCTVRMSKSEFRTTSNTSSRTSTGIDSLMLPDDDLNTPRVHEQHHAERLLGEPGRPRPCLAPANSASCIQVKEGTARRAAGDSRRGSSASISVTKRFGVGAREHRSAVRRAERDGHAELAVTGRPPRMAVTAASFSRVTAAYTTQQHHDPGGRVGQLMFHSPGNHRRASRGRPSTAPVRPRAAPALVRG